MVCRQAGKAYEQKNIIPMVKHTVVPVLLWGCFAATESGKLDCMKNFMNSLKYQVILAKTVMPLIHRLKLMITGLSSIPKHTSKSTEAWFWDLMWNVLEWPVQSSDLNLIKIFGGIWRKQWQHENQRLSVIWNLFHMRYGLRFQWRAAVSRSS